MTVLVDGLLLLLSIAGYYLLHSVLAASSVKTRLYQIIAPRYYRIFYNLIAVLSLAPILLIYLGSSKLPLFATNEITNTLGLLLLILGGLLLILSLRQYDLGEFIGTRNSTSASISSTQELQTTGLNSLVRHPLYFAALIIVWAWFLKRATSSDLIIAILTSLYLIVGIHLEEKKLVEEFGKDYLAYQKKVKKLIPFIF